MLKVCRLAFNVVILLSSAIGCGSAVVEPPNIAARTTPALSPPAARALPATSTATVTPSSIPSPPVASSTPTPVRLSLKVDVGGYRLQIRCLGEGSPTVVFDSGYGTSGLTWVSGPGKVSPWQEVAKITRACIYDRAGLGDSDADPGPRPRTSQRMADELHTLLTNAGIHGPYIPVGWSFGGFNVRLFTSQHRDAVAGLVLVDSSHEEQDAHFDGLAPLLPPETADECPALKGLRRAPAVDDPRNNPEGVDFAASAQQVAATGTLDDLPLVVLTHGKPDLMPPCVPKEYQMQSEQMWQKLQAELVTLSSNSVHLVAEKSRHCIHCDQPELVIDAISKVIDAARTGTQLATP